MKNSFCLFSLLIRIVGAGLSGLVFLPLAFSESRLYSQNQSDTRANNLVSQTRLESDLVPIGKFLFLHAGSWFERDLRSNTQATYADNSVAPYLGVTVLPTSQVGASLDVQRVWPWGEGGIAADNNQQTVASTTTKRSPETVLRAALWHSLLFAPPRRWHFVETYSALVFTSRNEDHLSAQHWTKAGARGRFLPQVSTDLFAEFATMANNRRWPGENYGDTRVGLRLTWSAIRDANQYSVAVLGSRRVSRLWGPNSADWLGLLVIGAQL